VNPLAPAAVGRGESTVEPIGADAIAAETRPDVRRQWWARARRCAGLLVIGVLVVRLGTGPFVDGLRRTDPFALLAATAITALTTGCCAWRWRLVARGLGLRLDRGAALAAVFRSQFLNATLPGGIVGDVDRALAHGTGPVGTGARAVVWERFLGQVVQVALTVLVVVALPSSLRAVGLVAGAVVALAVVLAAALHRSRPRGPVAHLIGADFRKIMSQSSAPRGIAISSAVAVAGHLVVFLLAARTAGVPMSLSALLPAAALVLLGSGIPLNVAGWGPREGVAAWAFGATGLGMAAGVTTAVVYGVMALVATLPGAVVLLLGRRKWTAVDTSARVLVLHGGARG
jgi:glycosyltransferase 2 family protein